MTNNDRPAPVSYLDSIRAYQPTAGINAKFTQILLISDSDLAEVFVETGPTAEHLLDAMTIVRAHLDHMEEFLREGILLTSPTN